ncbi:MAG: ACP S-malonyltransferase [Deltaproteobacteria bacterium]|nr:ACP S-malonyltransferase [Deltaproteobacteria bacterium]
MHKVAFVFPGQGSQHIGMGKALCESYPYVRELFAKADAALGYSIAKLCFDGPDTELVRTENTQPALLSCAVAAAEVLKRELGLLPSLTAGHSLGEYAALVVAESLDFTDAVRLVHLRGRFMQAAVPEGLGAMAALVGLTSVDVTALCAESSTASEKAQIANDNGAGQLVISGHKPAVERAMALAKAKGCKLVKALPVSAPFHSQLMEPAAAQLAAELARVAVSVPRIPVVANIDAEPYPQGDRDAVRDRLVRQVSGTVRWEACVQRLVSLGATAIIEVGPGKVLQGLVKRIAPTVALGGFADPSGLAAIAALSSSSTH